MCQNGIFYERADENALIIEKIKDQVFWGTARFWLKVEIIEKMKDQVFWGSGRFWLEVEE